LDFKYKKHYYSEDGNPGGSALKDGRSGSDIIIKVPVGTIVKDIDDRKILADLDADKKRFIAAKGGKGGKGNSNFATPTNQAPRNAEKGYPGEEKKIILELKLIADVGLVGFPNAGKSTLISSISQARPKIADYPFTTLEPVLGIVKYKDYNTFTVADIPGIIEGAHRGKGLGIKFLKHIERTKLLLFLIDITSGNFEKDYVTLFNELKSYSRKLGEKEIIVGLSKADLLEEKELKKLKKISIHGKPINIFSSISRKGLNELLDALWNSLQS
jgi:GTP-binding protein